MATLGEITSESPEERLGEAVEIFLELVEAGNAPDPERFIANYPDLTDDLRAALEGLATVQQLIHAGSGSHLFGSRPLTPGDSIAGYRIIKELGRGGMGVVYEAMHVDLDRPVALKVLSGHVASGSDGRRRFLNEAKTAAGLHHTHIVPVFDVGQVDGLCYYAMQRIEGTGLDRVIRSLRDNRAVDSGSRVGTPGPTFQSTEEWIGSRPGPIDALPFSEPESGTDQTVSWRPEASLALPKSDETHSIPFQLPAGQSYYRWVAAIGQEAANALAYAHGCGVIHRDIKPSNLLVDAKGSLWVADFGLARRLEDPGLTRGENPLGTPRYMSPEQTEGRSLDGRSDLYSLGATLYELLVLRPPFNGQTSAELARQITALEPTPPRRLVKRLPRDLETIILKAMAKRPNDRYSNAAELADDLGRFLEFEPVRARRIGPVGRLWRLARRYPIASAATAMAATALIAAALIRHESLSRERDQARLHEATLEKSLEIAQEAEERANQALARAHFSNIRLRRDSAVPHRREDGLSQIESVLELRPAPETLADLRSEAVALLAARDVVERPALATREVDSLVTFPGRDQVVAVSKDRGELTIWKPSGEQIASRRTVLDAFAAERGERFDRFAWQPVIGVLGSNVAVPNPEGPGVRLIDPETGVITDLPLSGERVNHLWVASGHRLVTIEVENDPRRGVGHRRLQDSTVNLWDLQNPEEPLIKQLGDSDPQQGVESPFEFPLPLVSANPSSELVVVAWFQGSTITIFDAADGQELETISTDLNLTALAVSNDGLIAAAGDGRIQLFELGTDNSLMALPGLSDHPGLALLLRFSPDGSMLAIAGPGSGVDLWDPAANTLVASLPSTDWVRDLAFADDQTLLVATQDGTARWEIIEPIGQRRFSFSHQEPPMFPDFGADNTLLVPVERGRPQFRLDEECPTRRRSWPDDEFHSADLAFVSDDRLLAVKSDNVVLLNQAAIDRCGNRDPENILGKFNLPLSPEHRTERTRSKNKGPSQGPGFGGPPQLRARILAEAPDKSAVLISQLLVRREPRKPKEQEIPAELGLLLWQSHGNPTGTVKTLMLPSDQTAWPKVLGPYRTFPLSRIAAISPGSERLFYLDTGDRLQSVPIGDPNSGTTETLARFVKPTCLALNSSGTILAIGIEAGSILLIDSEDGRERGRITISEPEPGRSLIVTSVAFSPSDNTLAVGTRSGTLELWKLSGDTSPEPDRIFRFPGRRELVRAVTFSDDAQWLAAVDARIGQSDAVELWDLGELGESLDKIGLGW